MDVTVSTAACAIETLAIHSEDGTAVPALMRLPARGGGHPVVIFVHGYGLAGPRSEAELRESLTTGFVLPRFLAAGYAVVAATYRQPVPQAPEAVADIVAVVRYLRTRPEISADSILLWGISGGGAVALRVAGETPVCAIALEEPSGTNFSGAITERNLDQKLEIWTDPEPTHTPQIQHHLHEKIAKITCPIFVAWGDVHPSVVYLERVILPALVAGIRSFGHLQFAFYPGEPHGFSGQPGTQSGAHRFFTDCVAFFGTFLPTEPVAIPHDAVSRTSRR